MTQEKLTHEVIAQDFYEFDPDYWNPLPESFTSYHISHDALTDYIKRLSASNKETGFITFETDGEPYATEIDDAQFQRLLKYGSSSDLSE